MKSKTVKESNGYDGSVNICKSKVWTPTVIFIDVRSNLGTAVLTPKRARKLFQAGLQMCDELEEENK